MTLQDITGYESGVLIYKESGEAVMLNWAHIDGIPRQFANGLIGMGEALDDFDEVSQDVVDGDYLTAALEIAKLDADENGVDMPVIDKIYENPEVIAITFEGWC